MTISFLKKILIFCFIFTFIIFISADLKAQSDDDINEFLKSGKACYAKGLLNEAMLEFENVLIIDKTNFQARIWLAQIYIDKKDLVNARKLLTEASLQKPNHSKVKELQKLIGEANDYIKQDLVDPVIAETIYIIASSTKRRQYGLVIPEDKVIEENLEKKLLITSDEIFNKRNNKSEDTELFSNEQNITNIKSYEEESNPLNAIFDIHNRQGIKPALDKYFELLIKDPTIAAKDDRGLVDEGIRVFGTKFVETPNDIENRYYYGILQYINGLYSESYEILQPLRKSSSKYSASLKPYLILLDKWHDEENSRLAALKYEREQQQAKEAKEKEKKANESNDIWAKVKQKSEESKNSELASIGKKEAVAIHYEGYNLYKKGKLDKAIEKLTEAVSKDNDNPEYNYHLGLAWMDKGLAGDIDAYDKAIASYQKVVNISPNTKLGKDAQNMINDIQQTKSALGEK